MSRKELKHQPKADNVPEQIKGLQTIATAPATTTDKNNAAQGSNTTEEAQKIGGAPGEVMAVPRPAEEEGPVSKNTKTSWSESTAAASAVDRLQEAGTDDLGWNDFDAKTPIPVLHGMRNDDLWLLVRRFNKQTYHVKRLYDQNIEHGKHPEPSAEDLTSKRKRRLLKRRAKAQSKLLNQLDLNISDKESFSPEKLRSTLERSYITIVVGFAALFKHIARLRTWGEWKRSTFFCVAYFLAWGLGYLETAFVALLMLLVLSDHARSVLFPAAPLAAIDAKTGKAKVPASGHLGSRDSLTGGAETYSGEAVEQEASNLIGALGTVAVSTAAGSTDNKHKVTHTGSQIATDSEDSDAGADDSDDETAIEVDTGASGAEKTSKYAASKSTGKKEEKDALDAMPDLATAVSKGVEVKKAEGEGTLKGKNGESNTSKKDHTKEPMEKAIWKSLGPFLHFLNDATDTWERFAK